MISFEKCTLALLVYRFKKKSWILNCYFLGLVFILHWMRNAVTGLWFMISNLRQKLQNKFEILNCSIDCGIARFLTNETLSKSSLSLTLSLSLKCIAQSSSVFSNWLLTPAWWIILSLFIPIKCDCLRAGVTFRLNHCPVFCPSPSCTPSPASIQPTFQGHLSLKHIFLPWLYNLRGWKHYWNYTC